VNRLLSILKRGLVLILLLLCLSGCQEPVVEVDPEELNLIDHYVEELTLSLLDLEPDLMGWIREPYSENYPLKYDEERIAFLEEHLKNIRAIRELRQNETFPDESTILQWQVIVVRGSEEWLLEGPAVVNALSRIETLGDRVEQAISMIVDSEGTLDPAQSDLVLALIEELPLEIEEIREVFYK